VTATIRERLLVVSENSIPKKSQLASMERRADVNERQQRCGCRGLRSNITLYQGSHHTYFISVTLI